jgi:hypothetical protein
MKAHGSGPSGKTGDEHSQPETVQLLSDRLWQMQRNFRDKVQEVHVEYADRPDNTLNKMSSYYQQLAHFTGLLAQIAERNNAEVGPDDVTFGKTMPLPPGLTECFSKEYDARLLYEIKDMRGNYHDGDTADFTKQVTLYMDKLRDTYHITQGVQHRR